MSIIVIGDSFSSPTPQYTVWPTLLGERLGMPVENRAVPGSGFVSTGILPGRRDRFSRQLLTAKTVDPKLVIFFGSVNDRWADQRELCTTAWATLHAAQERYPNARHLWAGPQWSGPNPVESDVVRARDAVLQAVWGLNFQRWMDPLDQNWFPRDRPELWDVDKFHPGAAGHEHLAGIFHTAATQLLLSR